MLPPPRRLCVDCGQIVLAANVYVCVRVRACGSRAAAPPPPPLQHTADQQADVVFGATFAGIYNVVSGVFFIFIIIFFFRDRRGITRVAVGELNGLQREDLHRM